MSSPRVRAEWRNRVAAEYRSAVLTATVLRDAIIAGFPAPLLETALRIVRDELDHAALSHDCLRALGGDETPVPLDAADLIPGSAENVMVELVDGVVRDFCLGETFAVPLFQAMRAQTRHPAVLPVLTRILADESVHRQFGWDALDVLLEREGDAVRAHAGERLEGWLDGFRAAYAREVDAPLLTEPEREAGLMDLSRYREVFWETVRGDLARRFGARGIALPSGYARGSA